MIELFQSNQLERLVLTAIIGAIESFLLVSPTEM